MGLARSMDDEETTAKASQGVARRWLVPRQVPSPALLAPTLSTLLLPSTLERGSEDVGSLVDQKRMVYKFIDTIVLTRDAPQRLPSDGDHSAQRWG